MTVSDLVGDSVLYGGPDEESELWLASCSDDWRPKQTLKGPISDKARTRQAVGLVNFRAPQFSADKARIYFLVPEYYATTNAVFYINRSSGAVHFFATAVRYWVVPKGQYTGLRLSRRREPHNSDKENSP
jgi:hypothetical protein